MDSKIITQEYLREIFDYKDGHLYWKITTKKIKLNQRAGTIDGRGYFATGLNLKLYKNHRLIYFMHHGYLPKFIDHIDGNKLNNKIENLREATASQNQQNIKLQKNNTSGYKNVYWHKKPKKWCVALKINKVLKYFGFYKDIELADLVAQEMRDKYFGKYARHN
jgi:hypothetical protein